MTLEHFDLPSHWASALINGDYSGYDDDDIAALDAFSAWMVAEHGQCSCVGIGEDTWFQRTHDATRFDVLASTVSTFAFIGLTS